MYLIMHVHPTFSTGRLTSSQDRALGELMELDDTVRATMKRAQQLPAARLRLDFLCQTSRDLALTKKL
jgi:hypothetical protein